MTKQPDKHDALYLASAAKRDPIAFMYRCGVTGCGELLAAIHSTELGPLLVAHSTRRRQRLDPEDDVSTNPFVIDGWRSMSDDERRDAAWQRAAELVMQREVRDPQWAVRSYARLIGQQSHATAGLLRQPDHDAAWLHDWDDAITVSCSRHDMRVLTVAEAIALRRDPHHLSDSTAFVV